MLLEMKPLSIKAMSRIQPVLSKLSNDVSCIFLLPKVKKDCCGVAVIKIGPVIFACW